MGVGVPGREQRMQAALIEPLGHIAGVGPKLWNMMLADLLLAADPQRERWVTAGASMIAIDTLIHNFCTGQVCSSASTPNTARS